MSLLLINGNPRDSAGRLELLAWSMASRYRKRGTSPSPPVSLQARLPSGAQRCPEKIIVFRSEARRGAQTATGYPLRLVRLRPTHGLSRREQGRRSNETARSIVLKRPFYYGDQRSDEQGVSRFFSRSTIGFFGGQSLNRDDQPRCAGHVGASSALLQLVERQGIPASCYVKRGRWLPPNLQARAIVCPLRRNGSTVPGFRQTAFPEVSLGDTFPPKPGTRNVADLSSKI